MLSNHKPGSLEIVQDRRGGMGGERIGLGEILIDASERSMVTMVHDATPNLDSYLTGTCLRIVRQIKDTNFDQC